MYVRIKTLYRGGLSRALGASQSLWGLCTYRQASYTHTHIWSFSYRFMRCLMKLLCTGGIHKVPSSFEKPYIEGASQNPQEPCTYEGLCMQIHTNICTFEYFSYRNRGCFTKPLYRRASQGTLEHCKTPI